MADTPATVRASSHDDLSGSLLGSYRITGELNRGGMGAVFRARHELLGKDVAIKLLRPELSANTEMVERFFQEGRVATAIRHPGIVEVFDFGYHEDGRAYLVMEFLDGETLAARLATKGLDEIEAAVIARGIASALGAAHAKGIIHRDLKPDNIFLVPDPDMPSGERPKVLDFGIAKLAEEDHRRTSRTRTGALMGTPAYMAPEQAKAAGEIDQRADLYSLGCVLYEMLTGSPPFMAEGAGEIIAMQMFSEPEPPTTRRPGVSAEMARITMRLLRKDPEARFQNAFELVDALSGAIPTLSGRMPAAMPSTVRRQALVVPTQISPPAASPSMIGARPIDTPLPIALGPTPARRSLRPAVLAGVLTLGVAASVIAFLALRERPTPTPAPPPIPTVVHQTVIATTPSPAPEPVAPRDVSYHLDVVPNDATIEVDGDPVTLTAKGFFSAPPRPDRRLVVVRAPGYDDASATLAGDTDDSVRIELTRTGAKNRGDQVGRTPTRTSAGAKGPPTGVESGTGNDPNTIQNGSGSRWYGTIDDDDK